jgi:hypothetical protein
MSRLAVAFALALAAGGLVGCRAFDATTTATPPPRVSCSAGPVGATVGEIEWLAYACDDGRSVALIAAPGNPAAPFHFLVRPMPERVRVQGDGEGDRAATVAAFAELMSMDDADVAHLYARALLDADTNIAPDGG